MNEPLLQVADLTVRFPKHYGATEILRNVNLDLRPGETLGVVGESGSGKSLLGLTLLGLEPPAAKVTGTVFFRGRDVRSLRSRERRALRGREIAMIYQDALVSLNPGMKIRKQIQQAVGREGNRSPEELLRLVRLDETDRFLAAYPHQLSGGQRQRVLIAMAIARDPSVIIADEPTTALDVTVQAEILALLAMLRNELQFALLLISHDLGLVATVADRLAVMYAGDLEEVGLTRTLLDVPAHPYTAGLLGASRSLEERGDRLAQIPGAVPSPNSFSIGCRFYGRCFREREICGQERPAPMSSSKDTGHVLCHFPLDAPASADEEPLSVEAPVR